MESEKLLLAEYEQYSEAFWRNEEAGERRVTFFTTLAAALLTAIVALRTGETEVPWTEMVRLVSMALIAALIFGLVTFLRMLQRDRVTDEYKRIIHYIREQLRRRAADLGEYALPRLPPRHWLFKGGLATTVALINSVLVAALAMVSTPDGWKIAVVPAAFLASFAAHSFGIAMRKQEDEPSQTFRAGAGAVILNRNGDVLAFERCDKPDAWQMPQGGLTIGESPAQAVEREIQEETGIQPYHLELMARLDRPLAYELPVEKRSAKTGRGQVQYWFIYTFQGAERDINLERHNENMKKKHKEYEPEFVAWKWTTMDELVNSVVEFKKPVYRELAEYVRAFAPARDTAMHGPRKEQP